MKNYQDYFGVKNFAKTLSKHASKIDSLNERMQELGIEYSDIMDSDSWQTIDTQAEQKLSYWGDRQPKTKEVATLINGLTRQVIANSLEYYEMPKSWDTAFFMAHYMKTIEGMAEILENIEARRNEDN